MSSRKEMLAEYQKKMRGASGGGTSKSQNEWKRYVVKEGTHNLRILPAQDGKLSWRDVAFHYFGFTKGNKQFICPKVTLNQPCPICEAWDAIRFSKVEAEKKIAKVISPKSCSLFWVIDRENESEGPMIWTASYSPFNQLLTLFTNSDWENMDDPVDGNDIALTYTVIDNAPNKYAVNPRRPSPIFAKEGGEYDDEKFNAVIAKTFPLSECYKRSRSYEELKSILAVFEMGEDVNKFVINLDEEKKKARKDSQNGSTTETGETEESGGMEESEEPVTQKTATIDDAPKSEAPVVVSHQLLCFGEYDAKDTECQPGKCDSRKACMKKVSAGDGSTPVRDLMAGGTPKAATTTSEVTPKSNTTTSEVTPKSNTTTSQVDTKAVTVHGTSSLLEKAMKEARGKK